MKAAARIVGISGDRVRLACEAVGAQCGACGSGRLCVPRQLWGAAGAPLDLPRPGDDTGQFVTGDRVAVEIDDGRLLSAMARACLPPLAGVLCLPLLARALGWSGEGAALLAAAGGLLLGWALARAWLRRRPPQVALRVERPAEAPIVGKCQGQVGPLHGD